MPFMKYIMTLYKIDLHISDHIDNQDVIKYSGISKAAIIFLYFLKKRINVL